MNTLLVAFLYCGHVWHAQGVEEKPLPVNPLAELLFVQHHSGARSRNTGVPQRARKDMAMAARGRTDSDFEFPPTPSKEEALEYVNSLPGISAPVNRLFDPWGFSNAPKDRVKFYQEAELKHGRLAMLGVLGMLVGEQRNGAGLALSEVGPNMGSIGKFLAALALIEGYYAVKRIDTSDAFGRPSVDYTPGDIGFDPLNIAPKDPAKLKEMKTKELNNGRLAMLAAAGIWAQENVEGVKVLPFHFR